MAIAGLGSFLTINGYQTGWRTFLTGEVQPTQLRSTLLDMGLTPGQATVVEIGLAGGAGAAAGLSRNALKKAARRGLERAAIQRFTVEPLQVRVNCQSLWLEPDIAKRGEAWEVVDVGRTGFDRTPPGYPVFDQVSPDIRVAVSNKTIDLVAPGYERADRRLYLTLRRHIGQVAEFQRA